MTFQQITPVRFLISSLVASVVCFLSCSSPVKSKGKTLSLLAIDSQLRQMISKDMDCYRTKLMEGKSDTVFTVVPQKTDSVTFLRFYPGSTKVISGMSYTGYFRCNGFLFIVPGKDSESIFKKVEGATRDFEMRTIRKRKKNEVDPPVAPGNCFFWVYELKEGNYSRFNYDLCVDP